MEKEIEQEDRYFKMMDRLQERWGHLHANTQMDLEHITTQPAHNFWTRSTYSLISFTPILEEGSCKILCVRRFEVFLHLRDQEM